MKAGMIVAAVMVLASAVRAEEIAAADWAAVAEPAFAEGSYGESFVVMGKTMGCFNDEAFVICGVDGEGIVWMSAYGSVTPDAILDIIRRLPVGSEVLISGDVVADQGDRVEAVFSRILPPM